MNKFRNSGHKEENTLGELRKIIPGASQALLSLAGLSGAAYLIGWCFVDRYFSTLNADWIVSELSPGLVISKCFWPLALLFFFFWLGLYDMRKESSVVKSRIIFFVNTVWIFLIALIVLQIYFHIKTNTQWVIAISRITGLVSASWAAAGIHSLIFISKDRSLGWNFRSGRYILITVVGLIIASQKFGEGAALKDISVKQSTLPRIKLKKGALHDSLQVDIRLLLNAGDRFYAIELNDSSTTKTRIHLIKFEDILAIQFPLKQEIVKGFTKQNNNTPNNEMKANIQQDPLDKPHAQ